MDFKSTQESISTALVDTTRAASRISAEDIGFHRSLNPATGTSLDRQNARLLSLAEKLLGVSADTLDVGRPALPDIDAVENNWKGVVDVVDGLLERVDTCLDEFTGLVKRLSPSVQSQAPSPKPKSIRPKSSFRNQNIAKPQRLFEHAPDNSDTRPFVPLLTSKPNAIAPLQVLDSTEQYQHPYQIEIDSYQFPSSVTTKSEPIPYTPFEDSKATFVDTIEGVNEMLAELKQAKEIAIDLEHHDTHSYIGLVSLMQISTRNHDWIVDTLKPWRRNLEVLNEVFTDPSILKVFHGAHMDMIWLQRDLGLYVVGLFDTHHASRVLGYSGGSLAFLLKRFIDFDAQKQYQLADWRLRPLPEELIDYARSDTHFLLYIYDNMRNELVDKLETNEESEDPFQTVLSRSKEEALQRYENPVYDALRGIGSTGWFNLLSKTPTIMTKEQFAVFRAVHQWRDKVARQEDESLHLVMPSHNIFSIIRDIPEAVPNLLSCLHPISTFVRVRASELLGVIRRSKADSVNDPDVNSVLAASYEAAGMPWSSSKLLAAYKPQPQIQPNQMPHESTAAPFANTFELKSSTSNFWGPTAATASTATINRLPTTLNLAQSIPSLGTQSATLIQAEPSMEDLRLTEASQPDLLPPSPPDQTTPPELTEGLTNAKKLRRAHKRKADPATPPTFDDTAAAAKQRRRAERKAAKQARGEAEPQDKEVPQPFDYDAAPSVLHAVRERDDGGKKSFNPYTKGLDGAEGLPRAQSFRVGKSGTFKR